MASKKKAKATSHGPRRVRHAESGTQLRMEGIAVEGGLLSAGMLTRIAAAEATEQAMTDYGVVGGTLRDTAAQAFKAGRRIYRRMIEELAEDGRGGGHDWPIALKSVYPMLTEAFGVVPGDFGGSRNRTHASRNVDMEIGDERGLVTVTSPELSVDETRICHYHRDERLSAASALQEALNASDHATWGIATNGRTYRLMRDNSSLTRPSHVDVDLERIFESDDVGAFTAAWLLLHGSRFGRETDKDGACPLERWKTESESHGVVARKRLGDNVRDALQELGTGFLEHPENGGLRTRVTARIEGRTDLFRDCLRIVYRMIFLFASEDRELLHPTDADLEARRLYRDGYSMAALRDRAMRRSNYDRHDDMWQGLLVTFGLLQGVSDDEGDDEATRRAETRSVLGLSPLDGMFAKDTLTAIKGCRLSNRRLMTAIRKLAWLEGDDGVTRVDWLNMRTEEIGSVYEGLLDLNPSLGPDARSMTFATSDTKGTERKKTGSYYTPDCLVESVLEDALDPILDRAEASAGEEGIAESLLSLSIIDPACGSGHFLLSAARRMASRVARARGAPSTDKHAFTVAMRDVVRRCIHGVDRNPMAIEIAKVALWIETVDPGHPLGFLDVNIRCGDSLFGVYEVEALRIGIPDAAYEPLVGDDKGTARVFKRANLSEKGEQGRFLFEIGSSTMPVRWPLADETDEIKGMPEETADDVANRRRAFHNTEASQGARLRRACDIYCAAFLAPKRKPGAEGSVDEKPPTNDHVFKTCQGEGVDHADEDRWTDLSREARAFHWFLAFPDVMRRGGFDAVLGNPPWERIKLQEEEFFASHDQRISEAQNSSMRSAMIRALKGPEATAVERALHALFEKTKRSAEAASTFARTDVGEGGRYPLTGRGDVNTYALFAELFLTLLRPDGRAGIIVPTGIATDATTAPFFRAVVEKERLISLDDYENRESLFEAIDSRTKLCVLTLGKAKRDPIFAFFMTHPAQRKETGRRYAMSRADIRLINPNTQTSPIFRSEADAALTRGIYDRTPVLVNEKEGPQGNPWGISFSRMFDMSNDSKLFKTGGELARDGFLRRGSRWSRESRGAPRDPSIYGNVVEVDRMDDEYVPLYEAKMIHQFDHRWSSYDEVTPTSVSNEERADLAFEVTPRYWVPEREVRNRRQGKSETRHWMMGWRDITRSTDERTLISGLIPKVGVGDQFLIIDSQMPPNAMVALHGCLNSLTCDFVARQKVGNTHFKFFLMRQIAVPHPRMFDAVLLEYVVPRIVELAFTSHSMTAMAREVGYHGSPFIFDTSRREVIRAELDACYARLYGLTRDELRYILDPSSVKGAGNPSETFRVLKSKEVAKHGEFRTARLVLQAWDAQENESLRIAAE